MDGEVVRREFMVKALLLSVVRRKWSRDVEREEHREREKSICELYNLFL